MRFIRCNPSNAFIVRLSTYLLIAGAFFAAARPASADLGTLVKILPVAAARMATDPIRPRLYATVSGSNSVVVIDTNTLTILANIPIGSNPVGLAVSPDGSRLYVANSGATTSGVGVIDLSTLKTLPSLPTRYSPYEVAVGLNGWLYLTTESEVYPNGLMQVSTSGTVQSTFGGQFDSYEGAFIQISPDQKTLYVGNSGLDASTFVSFDVSTDTPVLSQQADSGGNGEDLCLSHFGAFLCYPNGAGNGPGYIMTEIPANNLNGSNGSFDVGAYPYNAAFSPDDEFVYTAPYTQGQIQVYNTSSFGFAGSFPVTGVIKRLITDNTGKYLFAAGENDYIASNPFIYAYETGRTAVVPAITSATSAVTGVDLPFTYQITASPTQAGYNASGLPPNLSVNTSTGIISGTPTALGITPVSISAGPATATLNLNVEDSLTVSGSGSVTSGLLGTTYYTLGSQVTVSATAAPGYTFTGWASTSGTFPAYPVGFIFSGTYSATLQANFVIAAPSFATGAVSSGQYGASYNYQIEPIGVGPFTYGATGLPAGLSLDSNTGIISGTLADAGDFAVALTATNSAGGGGGTLQLNVGARLDVSTGLGGQVKPAGITFPSLSSTVTVIATPNFGYYFNGWTGGITSTSDPLLFSMPVSIALQANFAPWANLAEGYSGLLSPAVPSASGAGSLAINIINTGYFTGSIVLDGVKYSFTGAFPSSLSTTVTIRRRNLPSVTLDLTIDASGADPVVTGMVTDGTWSDTLSANATTTYLRSVPCPRAGLYTAALYSSTDSATIPAGAGYGTITISNAGLARFAGTLADGTPFTASSTISSGGTLLVMDFLYHKDGFLSGPLAFQSASSTGVIAGTLGWLKPLTSSHGLFPASFSTTLNVAGSSYFSGVRLTGSGSLAFADGANPFTQAFTVNANHIPVITQPNPHSVTFNLDSKTGAFSGDFVDSQKTRHFHGVLLQQQNAGAGYFSDSPGNGNVTLTISP
jgi:YVTN family beta-propeller protein